MSPDVSASTESSRCTTLTPGPPGSLDASLKKHTTLLNKLRTNLLVGPSDALIKEIDGLTLTKYLEEIVAAVVEGASRGKGDAEVAVDVSCSLTIAADHIDHHPSPYSTGSRLLPARSQPPSCWIGTWTSSEGCGQRGERTYRQAEDLAADSRRVGSRRCMA